MNAWLKGIDQATTQAQIVATARDYVSLYSPPELAPFPEECRTIRIDGHDDIPVWREKLAKGYERAAVNAPNAARLQDLVTYFARATERLGEIS